MKRSCAHCTRRKVRCDKTDPCSNCAKAQIQCTYEARAVSRPRKRAADEDLMARISRYEDLMRKHNVDFAQHANTWVSSEVEAKVHEDEPSSPVSIRPVVGDQKSSADDPHLAATTTERCLWLNLPSELKYPPVQTIRYRDDPFLYPTPPLQSMMIDPGPELSSLHPEPRSIFRLWQQFVESINPLTKIVHVPTLQPRVLQASWDMENTPKSLNALLFSIYTLAITSMSSSECQSAFNEDRITLLTRYRVATIRALIAADFLTTREVEVLQALVLFLFADPESELTITLTGIAMRLGQKLGLHRDQSNSKLSFFDKEMRIRLWWSLCGFWSRVSMAEATGGKGLVLEVGDVRLPLNVNDADLHPDMTEAPIESNRPTEMLCVLMKLELPNWLRFSPVSQKLFENILRTGSARGRGSRAPEDNAINKIDNIYREKYLCHLDSRIPLHGLARAMICLTISRVRFKTYHPRGRFATVGTAEIQLSTTERDVLFHSAVNMLEMMDYCSRTKLSSHMITYMTSSSQVDAYIYVLSDLRIRRSGDRVAVAWKLIEGLYYHHPQLIDEPDNTFYVALGELVLEAWAARKEELLVVQGLCESDITPRFIQILMGKSSKGGWEGVDVTAHHPYTTGIDEYGLMDYLNINWESWDEFLRL
ncbi:fungal-specific transcription factor domain-containing protein [Xylariales sp. PMI_506]|nr:fungal-specific transcription factor domain-containing protein [Xylariales sp. PMI_506]